MTVVDSLASPVAARTLPDLIGLIPYLLGFHPTESLVAVVTEHDQVSVTARADLSRMHPPGCVEELLGRLWARFPGAHGWFVVYGGDTEAAWALLRRCEQVVPAAAVDATIVVDGALWWSDPDGPASQLEPPSGSAVAQAVVNGMAAQASRGCVVASIAGPVGDALTAAQAALARADQAIGRKSDPAKLIRPLLACDPGDLSDDECVRLAALAADSDARDQAILAITVVSAPRHLRLWQRVVRLCPPSHRAAPLALLGLAAWAGGEGALHTVCVEEAQRLCPDLPLVQVLTYIDDNIIPPQTWPALRRELAHTLNCTGTRKTPVIRA